MSKQRGGPPDYFNNSLRQFIEQQNEMEERLFPGNAFKEQMDHVLGTSHMLRELVESNRLVTSPFTNPELLESIEGLTGSSSFFAHADKWQELLGIQNSLALSDEMLKAASGFDIDTNLFSRSSLGIHPKQLQTILDTLATDSILLAEFGVETYGSEDDEFIEEDEQYEEEQAEEESIILLPEHYEEQLKAVNYLPVTLYKKILNDPRLMRKIDPRKFEYFIAELIEKLGFENVVVTPQSGDAGQDVLATRQINGINMLFSFECKRYRKSNKIGPGIMRSLLGSISQSQAKATMGILITTSSFTSGSKKLIASEASLDGKDFNDLVGWINDVKQGT